ncbi:MAG: pitrilysin family protein [Dehalococcoidia bacterium]|nr:pitrilysin family protein [Dehalococcoidia bacterium]
MYKLTHLDNGLRIVTSTMPNTYSVCVTIFVATGSRYETDGNAGISHFLEHILFKGSKRWATPRELSEAIEGVGGILNGGTDKELTVYWTKVARPHFQLAVDVLSDMFRYPRFKPEEVEKERQVIFEEINMSRDSPSQRVDLLIDEVLWPNQPLGRDVAGSRETISNTSRQNLMDFMSSQYLPVNTVIAVAGDISHDEVLERLHQSFDSWKGGQPQKWFPAIDNQNTPRFQVETMETEQANICLALKGISGFNPQRFTMGLLNVILGEGMSSRLFLEIREKRGLAYEIHSYPQFFLDSGSFIVYAGIDPQKMESGIEAILSELSRLREPIPEAEVVKAREFFKGRMLLRMEDTRSVAGFLGGQLLLTGNILTVDEIVARIDKVTAEEIQNLARQLIVTPKLNLAVVGPKINTDRLQNLLKV